ncbi:MAG: class I SAM-dependent methyltransferase [Bryobacteraceae bacterium]
MDFVKRRSARTILEAGCGTGMWVGLLRAAGANVIGVDPSMGMLTQASARLGSSGLVLARANELPFERKQFDLIYAVNAIHHFDDPQAFISSAAALLNPRGTLAVIGIDPRTIRRRYLYE